MSDIVLEIYPTSSYICLKSCKGAVLVSRLIKILICLAPISKGDRTIDQREHQIEELLKAALLNEGYEIVCVMIQGKHRPILEITIERVDRVLITADDCAKASRVASVHLDVHDPFPAAYLLTVSSPGLERPLVKPEHFKRFCGSKVLVKTLMGVDGRKKFTGLLLEAGDDEIKLKLVDGDEDAITIPYREIRSAKLLEE